MPIGSRSVVAMLFCYFAVLAGSNVPAHAQQQYFAYVLNQADGTVSVISTATNAVVATVPVDVAPGVDLEQSVAVTPNGAFAYVANYVGYSSPGTVSVISTDTNAVVATIPVGTAPGGVAIAPTGTFAYVANQGDNTISVIDTFTNAVTATVPLPAGTCATNSGNPCGIAFTQKGAFAYVAGNHSDSSAVINTATNTATTITNANIPGGTIALSPGASTAYVALFYGYVSVINTSTNAVTTTWSLNGGQGGIGLSALAVTPDGSTVYIVAQGTNSVLVVSTATGTVSASIPVGSSPLGLAMTPDGAYVYTTNSGNGTVSVISTATNTVVNTITVGNVPTAVAIAVPRDYSLLNGGNTFNGNQQVNGALNVSGTVSAGTAAFGTLTSTDTVLLPTGTASANTPANSYPLDFVASSFFNGSAVNQLFRLQAEGNGAANSGTLNLLYGSGNNAPAETGLSIAQNGVITFAPGQTFPGGGGGSGTITGVTAGTGLSGGGSSGNVSLSVNESVVAFQSDLTNGINTAEAFATSAASTAQSNAQTYVNNAFLPLTGGTLTGGLAGTTGNFSGNLQASAGTFSSTLSAGGLLTANGGAALPATGNSQTSGSPSNPLDLIASASNGTTASNERFRWQAVNADGASPTANLNLLFGAGSNTPSATGLSIAPSGIISFAPGQTLPIGAGSVTDSMLQNPSLTVNAGAGLTGGGTVSLGGTTTVSMATNTCAAGSAVTAHPFTCSPFATLGVNTFTGTQTMPTLTVSGAATNAVVNVTNTATGNSLGPGNTGISVNAIGTGVYASGIGAGVVATGSIGVLGISSSGAGVSGNSSSSNGVQGGTSSTTATTAAGVFNNNGSTNAGNILLGQYNGTTELTVDAKGDVTGAGVAKFGSYSVSGTAPKCTFTSGGGTSPSCTLDTGSTNSAGIIIATTGSGLPAGTGTITLTFSATFGTDKPVCLYQASNVGTGKWNGLAVMQDNIPSTTSDLFTWTNGILPTFLTAKETYYINYYCFAK